MRPRASQVARIRLVETEEDVETDIRLLHGSVSGIVVRPPDHTTDGTPDGLVHHQNHLHDGEPAIVGGVSVHEVEDGALA